MIEYKNLIRCVRCLEHLQIYFNKSEYNQMYNKFVDILEKETNLSMKELYGSLGVIKPNDETNALEAIAFLNRFIDENRSKMDIKERQKYLKIISPLIRDIQLNNDLSHSDIYSQGDELIKKYVI
jgi:hypothetical protein